MLQNMKLSQGKCLRRICVDFKCLNCNVERWPTFEKLWPNVHSFLIAVEHLTCCVIVQCLKVCHFNYTCIGCALGVGISVVAKQ